MANTTKTRTKRKTKTKVKRVAKPRPLLTTDELKTEEGRLASEFPPVRVNVKTGEITTLKRGTRIVKGSFRNRGQDPGKREEFENKRTLEIVCGYPGCKKKRRVATSDLHQVVMCVEHTEEVRALRKRLARQARAAAKPK
jgi:hypothetical protein